MRLKCDKEATFSDKRFGTTNVGGLDSMEQHYQDDKIEEKEQVLKYTDDAETSNDSEVIAKTTRFLQLCMRNIIKQALFAMFNVLGSNPICETSMELWVSSKSYAFVYWVVS